MNEEQPIKTTLRWYASHHPYGYAIERVTVRKYADGRETSCCDNLGVFDTAREATNAMERLLLHSQKAADAMERMEQ